MSYVPTPRSIHPQARHVSARSCGHFAEVDLPALIAQGRGDVPIRELPFRCAICGERRFDLSISGAKRLLGAYQR